jgi:hypothetical protein
VLRHILSHCCTCVRKLHLHLTCKESFAARSLCDAVRKGLYAFKKAHGKMQCFTILQDSTFYALDNGKGICFCMREYMHVRVPPWSPYHTSLGVLHLHAPHDSADVRVSQSAQPLCLPPCQHVHKYCDY